MSEALTFEKLSKTNALRCVTAFHAMDDWSPNDYATALAGKVGEACNFLKKIKRLDSEAMTLDEMQSKAVSLTAEVAKELADAVCYIDLLATRLNINLEQAVVSKFNEVSDRKGTDIKL